MHNGAMTLSEAIERLYVAFASRPRRESIDGCPHCVDTEDQARLARVPLRQLSSDQLSRFAFKAMTTWGEPQDYAHFLPRILELSVFGGELGLNLKFVAQKLSYGHWKSWPQHEQQAIREVYETAWRDELLSEPRRGRTSDLLDALFVLFGELSPFLAEWEADGSLNSALRLAEVLDEHWADLAKHGYLQRGPPIGHWLMEPARKRFLEATFEQQFGTKHADVLAKAIDHYQWFRT